MILKFEQLSNDLFTRFQCTCPDVAFKNSPVAGLMRTTIRLTGYNDSYFFTEVNKAPREIQCGCGKKYTIQWFPDGVEVNEVKE